VSEIDDRKLRSAMCRRYRVHIELSVIAAIVRGEQRQSISDNRAVPTQLPAITRSKTNRRGRLGRTRAITKVRAELNDFPQGALSFSSSVTPTSPAVPSFRRSNWV
jgi:hypothetical protein